MPSGVFLGSCCINNGRTSTSVWMCLLREPESSPQLPHKWTEIVWTNKNISQIRNIVSQTILCVCNVLVAIWINFPSFLLKQFFVILSGCFRERCGVKRVKCCQGKNLFCYFTTGLSLWSKIIHREMCFTFLLCTSLSSFPHRSYLYKETRNLRDCGKIIKSKIPWNITRRSLFDFIAVEFSISLKEILSMILGHISRWRRGS